MATKSLLILYIVVLLSITNFGVTLSSANEEKTWCVAKPSSDKISLQKILSYACSVIDCGAIQPGGSCYEPKSLLSHASVAMNAYYQSRGRNSWNCYFNGTGIVTSTDPSFCNCKYD
ncbi:hypothetical protein LUZ60_008982 [Juncus effusus]|nr:hypothetical protein LUZ60_008982 [Juncus effusus]